MSRVQYYAAVSLDGYIAQSDGGLQWLFDAADNPLEGGDANYNAFFAQVGALAIGADTYEIMLRHEWAYAGVPAWVFTHREFATPPDADIRFVQGSVGDHIADMRAAAGDGNVWVVGGGALASQFAEAGELDELIVSYMPVALGTGIPLLAGPIAGQLDLVSTEELTRGAVQHIYALKTPSR
jgi:dihydrofolate reductase